MLAPSICTFSSVASPSNFLRLASHSSKLHYTRKPIVCTRSELNYGRIHMIFFCFFSIGVHYQTALISLGKTLSKGWICDNLCQVHTDEEWRRGRCFWEECRGRALGLLEKRRIYAFVMCLGSSTHATCSVGPLYCYAKMLVSISYNKNLMAGIRIKFLSCYHSFTDASRMVALCGSCTLYFLWHLMFWKSLSWKLLSAFSMALVVKCSEFQTLFSSLCYCSTSVMSYKRIQGVGQENHSI